LLKNRVIRYEVLTLAEKRWIIDSIVESEQQAIACAEALLKTDKFEAVKVMRERAMMDGFSTVKPIFEQARDNKPKQKEITLSTTPESDAWCETLEDFYGDNSRRAIGQILRAFLDRMAITPTELLHDFGYFKKLDAAGTLVGAAVYKIASVQAAARGVAVKERSDLLNSFVSKATARIRDAQSARGMPDLGAAGLPGLFAAVARKIPNAADRDFAIKRAVTRALSNVSGFGAKLDKVLTLFVDGLDGPAVALLDGLLADILGSATVIQDLLGRQPNLGGALLTLANLATGRHDGVIAGSLPALQPLNKLIIERELPACRAVLLERLRRELSGDKPLCRDQGQAQTALFNSVVDRLKDARGGFIGGIPMAQAIATRSRRLKIVGGAEEVRFSSDDPAERLEQLLKLEKTTFGDTPKRIIATHMLEILERLGSDADPTLTALKPKLISADLPLPAREIIAKRLNQAGGA